MRTLVLTLSVTGIGALPLSCSSAPRERETERLLQTLARVADARGQGDFGRATASLGSLRQQLETAGWSEREYLARLDAADEAYELQEFSIVVEILAPLATLGQGHAFYADQGWRAHENLAVATYALEDFEGAAHHNAELLELDAPQASRLHARYRLALIQQRLGRLEEAQSELDAVVSEAADAGDDRLRRRAILNRVDLAQETGRLLDAARDLDALAEESEGLDGHGLAELEYARGLFHIEMRLWTEAREHMLRTLEILSDAGDPYLATHAYLDLAHAELWLGRPAAARDAAEEALALATGLQQRLTACRARTLLADGWLRAGDAQRAQGIASEALALLGPHRDWEGSVATATILAEAALGTGELETAREAITRAKRLLRQSEDPVLGTRARGAQWAQYGRLSEVENQLWIEAYERADRSEDQRAVVAEALAARHEWRSRGLGSESRFVGAGAEALASLQRERLGGTEAVLEFLWGRSEVAVILVGRERVDLVQLGGVDAWSDRAGALHRACASASAAPLGKFLEAARPVSEGILHALGEDAEAWSRLWVVPDGPLESVPFHALVAAAPADVRAFGQIEFFVDRWLVVRTLSAYSLLDSPREGASLEDGQWVVIADAPEAQATDWGEGTQLALAGGSIPRLPRLPGTRAEAQAILEVSERPEVASTWRPSGEGGAVPWRGERVTLLTASAAHFNHLQTALRDGCSLLHVAAHAYSDARFPARSGILLAPNPEDGRRWLTSDEIAEFDLQRCTVVLSACDTAAGRLWDGIGAQSVARAFAAAGADHVVASLWPVADSSTSLLMQEFYARLADGDGLAEALRRAQRRVRGTRFVEPGGLALRSPGGERLGENADAEPASLMGHPSHWAAFELLTLRR